MPYKPWSEQFSVDQSHLRQTEAGQQVALLLQVGSSEPDGLSDVGDDRHLLARVQALGHSGQGAVSLLQHSLNQISEKH